MSGADWRHPAGPNTDIKGKEIYPVVMIALRGRSRLRAQPSLEVTKGTDREQKSVADQWPFERLSLYFRAEYFNIFNHPMFAPPSANFNNCFRGSGFGTITSTLSNFLFQAPGTLGPLYQIGGSRSGQLTFKMQF